MHTNLCPSKGEGNELPNRLSTTSTFSSCRIEREISTVQREKVKMHSRPELTGVTTGAFSAVGSTRGETSVAFAADLLLAIIFGSEGLQRRFNDATTKTEDEVEGRLLRRAKVSVSRQQGG